MSENRTAAETIYPDQAAQEAAEAAEATNADTATTTTTTTEAPGEAGAAPKEPGSTVITGKQDEAPKAEAEPPPPPFDPDGITFPDGVKPDPEVFGKFGEIAKTAGLSQATAQSLMDLYHTVVSAEVSKNLEAWKTTREGWVAAVKADAEIGGSNLDEVRRTVGKLLDDSSLSDPRFREALEVTGIGDNPAAIRTLYRWAKALSEGTHVGGDAPSRRAPRSLAEIMYPNLSQRSE